MLTPWICILMCVMAPGPLESGWGLLDAGRNAEAAAFFGDRHAAVPSSANAQGLAEALRRRCLLRDSLDRFGAGADSTFAAALAMAAGNEPDRAVPLFVRAARQSLVAGDSASAAAAALDGAEVALRSGHFGTADSLAHLAVDLADVRGDRRTALAGRVRLADGLNFAGDFGAADSLYALVSRDAGRSGHTAAACDANNGRGSLASRQRRVDVSRRHYRAALSLARRLDDRRRQVRILANLAYDHTQARDTDAARRLLTEAFALADTCDFADIRGHLHTGLAAAYETDGDRDGAVEHFRLAVGIFVDMQDEGGELGARQRLAFNLMMSGRYAAAVAHYDACLGIIERRDSPHILNWVLAGLALTHHKLGNLDRAEHFYRRSMEQSEAFGDRMSEAWIRRSLGLLAMLRGQYSLALSHHHDALEISRAIEDMEGVGESLETLAAVHYRLGDWDAARRHYEQAVDIAREHDLEELLRAAVSGLAALGRAAGRPALAREYCETALAIARRWQDSTATIWALIELAEIELDCGDLTAARSHLATAEPLLQPSGQFVLRSRILLLQARCAHRPDRALGLAADALEQARSGGLPESEWSCLTARGAWRLALGDTAGALADQTEAVGIVESLRRNVGHDELRRHMLRPALLPYERIIDLLAGDGRPGGALDALVYAERSRAQILAGRLRAALAGRVTGDSAATSEERDALAAIIHHQSRLQDPGLTDEQRADARRRVAELETRYLVLRLGAGQDQGPSAYATVPPRPQDLLSVLHPGEQAVVFFLGTERSWAFWVGEGRVTAAPLPGRSSIEGLVRRYLSLREAGDTSPLLMAAASRRLYDLLLRPPSSVGGETAPTLVVVPDGLLHRLPLAALDDGHGPLVARRRVFTAPSLQALSYLRQREAERRHGQDDRSLVVAVGHGGPPDRDRVHPYAGRPFTHLAHAEAEAHAVARLFPHAEVLTGTRATETALAAAPLHRAAVLHLAAHGDVDDRVVRRSFVLLEQDDPAGGDGLLQWGEAAALELRASLVTLASCRSARGVLAVGEGVTGLTQAFLFAGGTCVLAAQDDITDAFARDFMQDFYRHLRDGDSAAAALQQAQLAAAARGPDTRWADFVLVGDGAVTLPVALTERKPAMNRSAFLALGGLAAALSFLVLGRRLGRRKGKSVSSEDGESPTG